MLELIRLPKAVTLDRGPWQLRYSGPTVTADMQGRQLWVRAQKATSATEKLVANTAIIAQLLPISSRLEILSDRAYSRAGTNGRALCDTALAHRKARHI